MFTKSKMKYQITTTLILVCFVFAAVIISCERNTETTGYTEVAMDLSLENENVKKEWIQSVLRESLPKWDEKINHSTNNAYKESFTKNDPMALASMVSNKQFSFDREFDKNSTVYRSEDKHSAMIHADGLSTWKLFMPLEPTNGKSKGLTDQEALDLTEDIFVKFKLPEDELGETLSVGVGETLAGPDGKIIHSKIIARHVKLLREVNDIEVAGSVLMATYNLDGKLFRTKVSWPVFKLQEGAKVHDRDTVIDAISNELASEQNKNRNLQEIQSNLVYSYDSKNKVFEPALNVLASYEDDGVSFNQPKEINYSLINGIRKIEEKESFEIPLERE